MLTQRFVTGSSLRALAGLVVAAGVAPVFAADVSPETVIDQVRIVLQTKLMSDPVVLWSLEGDDEAVAMVRRTSWVVELAHSRFQRIQPSTMPSGCGGDPRAAFNRSTGLRCAGRPCV